MAELIQLRRGDAAEWAAVNPVLAAGEPAAELDTGKQKIGDGSTAWNDLPYSGGATAADIEFTPAGNLAATEVQAALTELDAEKSPTGHTHTAAEVGAIATSAKGVANGVASLGADGKVPSGQLPASSSSATKTINAQTGTAYTLTPTDAGAFVTMTNAAASTLTVPTNASVAFPVGTVIEGAQLGAGQVTITPAAGVTVNATPGRKVAAQYGTFGIIKTATDTWVAFGRLAA